MVFGASGDAGVNATVVPLPWSKLTVPGTAVVPRDSCTDDAVRDALATGSLKTIMRLPFSG